MNKRKVNLSQEDEWDPDAKGAEPGERAWLRRALVRCR